MKIYINSKYWANINSTKDNIIKNSKFIINKSIYNEFYTHTGIFRLIKNSYYKDNIIEENKIDELSYNNHNFIFDTTKTTFSTETNNECFQLPYQHHHRTITEYKIKTIPKSTISLNFIVNQHNEVEDWYFVTNEKFDTIKEDVFEFLSLFN